MDQQSRPSAVHDLQVEAPTAVTISLVLGLGWLGLAIGAVGGNDWEVLGAAVLAGVTLRQALSQLAWRRRVRRHIEIAHPGEPIPTRGFFF